MIALIAAAVAAAQPAPIPAQGHAMAMNSAQHEAMKDKCCCEHMGDGGRDMRDMHAPSSRPQDQRGE